MRPLYLVLFSSLLFASDGNAEQSQPAADTQVSATAQSTAASAPAAQEKSETEKLNEWFEVKYEEELMKSPIGLTFQGRKERYGELDDLTEKAQIEQIDWKGQTVAEMKAMFDYDKLTPDAQLSYDLWEHQYQMAEASKPFMRRGYVFHQMNGVHSFIPTFMINFHKVDSEQDMVDYVSRLRAIGPGMNELISQAKTAASEGVRPPRFAYEIVTDEAKAIITGKPFDDSDTASSLWADVNAKVAALVEKEAITQKRADELTAQAKAALLESLAPAYKNLVTFLTEDIKQSDDVAQGVHALPQGDAFYAYRLKTITTTDMTADEIHELGLKEVERIRAQMEAIKDQDGFKGTLQEYFAHIRDSKDNSRYYFDNTDEGRQGYIDAATAAIDNIKKELPNYFGILPQADLVVKRVESFREQDGAPQHYFPGTPDGSRPGIYYAHLSDMKAMPKNELEVIAYHEGLPGHHMQISIAQELKDIPTFRTQAGSTAYIEGWALYSEALAKEMPDTYTTLNSEFGRLGSEIWRAIRLVVDTGMHHKKWSQQQAIDFFAANSPAPQQAIEAEIRRYLVIPGQATAYKIGMIDIQRLRKISEDALGDKFDIRAFHDTILGGGALPLNLLERKVKRWIQETKQA
ncbi:hypothetical protein GCM10008090_02080 [Arenicella chitinivorans]|uniref:DUF885 domain-containing protein n=1 Tax=Arenicella chitinivorans TaxID=1329800 RepID=A0A918VHM0_9GAMM|nr:DUF885 domain-containing protein [Arenicella chitinivorans]GGZ97382.1 hypothetical protein GCM10008090_02080 [Arenicella chitinivorans]